MTGLEFYRKKRQMTRDVLAELAGVTRESILIYEHRGFSAGTSMQMLLALTTALEITVDELVADHDEAELTTIDRSVRPSNIVSPGNVIYRYKVVHNLRYDELATILGLAARESARYVCKCKTAGKKHVIRLCQHEHMSEDEFLLRYACA